MNKDTAWRWRHRLLQAWARAHPRALRGVVETLQRRLPIYGAEPSVSARRRIAWPSPGERVLLARDESTAVAWRVTGERPAALSDYELLLGPRVPEITRLIGLAGRASPAAAFANAHRLVYARHPGSELQSDLPSPGDRIDVRTYGCRLRTWMRRFRGVAVRYLFTYVHWHQVLESPVAAAHRLLLEAQRAPPARDWLVADRW